MYLMNLMLFMYLSLEMFSETSIISVIFYVLIKRNKDWSVYWNLFNKFERSIGFFKTLNSELQYFSDFNIRSGTIPQ